MAGKLTSKQEGTETILFIEGDLNFEIRQKCLTAFRAAATATPPATRCVLDLHGVKSIESSGLGLLFMIKEEAEKGAVTLEIVNPSVNVRKILEMAYIHEAINIK